ncbi:hypothetical protein [Bacillus sp. 1P06AnD]|uniref:YphA family membrane protein n=1 Tax=Bacillus sp. 1P06AnD TaxID=3132208 RepID=UPI0039A3F1FA
MMEGLIFIWSSWLLILVFFFFFYKKIPHLFTILLLCLLFMSQFTIKAGSMPINMGAIGVILIACVYMSSLRWKDQFWVGISSFTIALCLGSYEFFSSMEPIGFLWLPDWSVYGIIVLLSILLMKSKGQRIIALTMGMVIHDLLFLIIYFRFGILYPILSLAWLDHLAIVTLFHIGFSALQMITIGYLTNNKVIQHKKEV